MENYKESLSACESVLKLDAGNVKALYRAGRVLGHMGEWGEAVVRLEKAAMLDPGNKVIQTELQKTLKKKESSEKREKDMYRRMVSGGATKQKETRAKPTSSSPSSSWVWSSSYCHRIASYSTPYLCLLPELCILFKIIMYIL